MPSSRRHGTSRSDRSSRSGNSKSSKPKGSFDSRSTTQISPNTSLTSSNGGMSRSPPSYESCRTEDVSPSTSLFARSSVDSYASTTASEGDLLERLDVDSGADLENWSSIPPLPAYCREAAEPNVRPSSPPEFGRLFPSLNRLSIRHDEFTEDGNMNLRVDTVITGRRRTAIQLFHLRMHNLERRDFSLRRYCRDSGREVCNAKRKYAEPATSSLDQAVEGRPLLQRSVTSAIKTLSGRPAFGRTNSSNSIASGSHGARPNTSHSYGDGDDESTAADGPSNPSLTAAAASSAGKTKPKRPAPTNTIKLEFSNYARVDVTRRHHGRYEFDWWGQRYAWRRAAAKPALSGGVADGASFHLVRNGDAAHPVAHIVPETRSPSQVLADENAGGWVPPCYMWIADESVINAMTDVADVIMATGLMALVDDCIIERLQPRKVHRIPVPLTSRTVDVPQLFRRNTSGHRPSPLRFDRAISAY